MTISYDEDSDVLYVTFARSKSSVRYVETERGDVLRFCVDTNQIVGVTVVYFAYRSAKGERIDIPEIGVVTFSTAMADRIGSSHDNTVH